MSVLAAGFENLYHGMIAAVEFTVGLEHLAAGLIGGGVGGGVGGLTLLAKAKRAARAALIAGVSSLTDEQAETIITEVTPNGGDTDRLGDRVVRIEAHMDANDKRFDRLESKFDQVAKDTATVAAWVTAGST